MNDGIEVEQTASAAEAIPEPAELAGKISEHEVVGVLARGGLPLGHRLETARS